MSSRRWSEDEVRIEAALARHPTFYAGDLSGLDLTGLRAKRPDFSRTDLRATNLRFATLDDPDFVEATVGTVDQDGSVNFGGATLVRPVFTGASLPWARMDGAYIKEGYGSEYTDFSHGSFGGAKVAGGSYQRTRFCGADCTKLVVIDVVDFSGSDWTGAILDGARLETANLRGVNLSGCTFSRETVFPPGLVADIMAAAGPVEPRHFNPADRFQLPNGFIVSARPPTLGDGALR